MSQPPCEPLGAERGMTSTGTRLPEFGGALYAKAMAKADPRMPEVFEALCAVHLYQRPSRWPASSRSSRRSGQQPLVFKALYAAAQPEDFEALKTHA
jgi:hypothetical protein